MSLALAELLRKSGPVYRDLWISQSRAEFGTEPRAEVVDRHLGYWNAIVAAVESGEFDELLKLSRDAGAFQFAMGFELSDAVRRTVEATNTIEIALLDAAGDDVSPKDIIGEIADLRSTIVMAVVEGYNASAAAERKPAAAREQLLATLLRSPEKYASLTLAASDEIGPLYEDDMRFYAVAGGKMRLYNLLPNGRTITLSILGEGDVFFQWRSQSGGLSCICAEAMAPSRVVSVSERDLGELLGSQPTAAIDVIGNFARRLTESHAIIEELMNNSINLRLYRTLSDLAGEFGKREGTSKAVLIDVPLTHQRLADMIGSNRVTVTRKLLELQKRGVIAARGSGSIEILDLDALNRLAIQVNA